MEISATSMAGLSYLSPSASVERAPGQEQQSEVDVAKAKEDKAKETEERKEIEQLKSRDREVRAHEQAHLAAAGSLATSGANYTYQRGPDGVNYAVGGDVKIDTSPGDTPEDTIRRAQIIRAAAMAPAEPSGQDRAVAAQAASMEADARAELATADMEDGEGGEETATAKATPSTEQRQDASHSEQPYAALEAFEPGKQVDVKV